jgi:hypothetical protein
MNEGTVTYANAQVQLTEAVARHIDAEQASTYARHILAEASDSASGMFRVAPRLGGYIVKVVARGTTPEGGTYTVTDLSKPAYGSCGDPHCSSC